MRDHADLSVGEALRRHYAASGLPQDGGRAAARWALINAGFPMIVLSNFRWRKRALPYHDIHHLLTGYPCTVAGELQIAAWEFAAGRFPHALSTLFCLPLVGLGTLIMPRRSFAAFVRGRRSRTLYLRYARHATAPSDALLAQRMSCLREHCLPRVEPRVTAADGLAYLGLASLSWAMMVAPLLALFALWRIHG